MMNVKIKFLLVIRLFAYTCAISVIPRVAANSLSIDLKMNQNLQAGIIRDGDRIGQGVISSYDNHVGFVLSGYRKTNTSQSGRYIMTGKNNQSNQVRVRLSLSGMAATELSASQGLKINTIDDRVSFDILADGDQLVRADIYNMLILGGVSPP